MAQVIGVPREVFPGEKRVATVPEVVPKLAKLGFGVIVESGAGSAANLDDEAYRAAGAPSPILKGRSRAESTGSSPFDPSSPRSRVADQ